MFPSGPNVMTCATCGRDNPGHLTFCQECGQRLGPRIAPPTPPIGLGADDEPPPPPQLASRVATIGTSDPPRAPSPEGGAAVRCNVCETTNAPNLRYCTSCGSTLATVAPAHAPPPPPIAPMR